MMFVPEQHEMEHVSQRKSIVKYSSTYLETFFEEKNFRIFKQVQDYLDT